MIDAALARLSPYILEAADLVLAHFMSRVAYLAPLRVRPDRAYRVQNLAVDEVDPDGENLAMFLRSLSSEESASFAAFTSNALGFETSVRTIGHHAEILVKSTKAKVFVNLVDVGFGYSEVLPLAAILWASCIRPVIGKREPTPLIAIEQPELHLHPAHQAELARMLVEAVSKGGGTRLLVETHSESLINGLGKLIYEGAIKAEDVQIVLFDQDEETEQTTVKLAGYRENGALYDWPYGFLSPVAGRRSPKAAAE
jgi:predicted ATPase